MKLMLLKKGTFELLPSQFIVLVERIFFVLESLAIDHRYCMSLPNLQLSFRCIFYRYKFRFASIQSIKIQKARSSLFNFIYDSTTRRLRIRTYTSSQTCTYSSTHWFKSFQKQLKTFLSHRTAIIVNMLRNMHHTLICVY